MDARLLELVEEFKEHVHRSSKDATDMKLSLLRIEGNQIRQDDKIDRHENRHDRTDKILEDYIAVKNKWRGAAWVIGILWIAFTAFEAWYFSR